uniref:Phospholipase A2 n=1 Tax=Panagrolaimus sp. PS1159 TaxID=55785 RepID=A0AC35G336_9BILA
MKPLFFIVIFYLLYFVIGYPDKRPVITVEEVSSEEEEESEQILDHQWSCGTDAFSLLISEGTIDKDCPESKNQVNNCCFAHDNCYDDQLGRDYCDDTFCNCLQTATENNKLCHEDDAHVFCNLVRQLGESAYNASGRLNSTATDSENDPLNDLISNSEALNQTSSEYYDYERNEKPQSETKKKIQRHRRSIILNAAAAEILSDPVVTRLVKTA